MTYDFASDLIETARIGSIIVVVDSLIIRNYALECHKRRCLQNRLEHSRQAWNNGPAICCRASAGPVHCPAHETRPPHPSENRCPSPYHRNGIKSSRYSNFPRFSIFTSGEFRRLAVSPTPTFYAYSHHPVPWLAVTRNSDRGQVKAKRKPIPVDIPAGYLAPPPLWIRRASASRDAEKCFPSARYFLGSGPSTASPTVPDRPLDPDVVANAKVVNKDPPVGPYAMPFDDSNAVKPRMQPVQRKPSSSPRTEIPYQPLARCGGSLRTGTPSHP